MGRALLLSIILFITTFATSNPFPFSPGFDIISVANIAETLPSHSWEFGTAAEALLEIYNPELSVFGPSPFPVPAVNSSTVKSLVYAKSKILFRSGASSLCHSGGAVGDPVSLGVSAVLLGKTDKSYAAAARRAVDYITQSAPRFWNGAISQRTDVAELWADFMYMAPPFLAYYAADSGNASQLYDVVQLCRQYRQILQANLTGDSKGAWEHIIGPQYQDTGIWSTGNGWAAAGMVRVLAVILKSPTFLSQQWKNQAIDQLTWYIKEIIDGAMTSPQDNTNLLLRNYLDDTMGDGHGFGEISGTSLLAAATYRMAGLCPEVFGPSYIRWADAVRTTLGNGQHVSKDGTVYPAVNPLDWQDTTPITAGSPEGNNFVVLMYAAWRDCVQTGICSQ